MRLLPLRLAVALAMAPPAAAGDWLTGAFVDAAYLYDSNEPANHLFRSRGTAFRVNEWDLNMAAAYARKTPSQDSRLGAELTLQAGKDSETFGYSATAPNLSGSETLRHLGPTSLSYLLPVGRGLTLQGGIFGSLIGYDSLYAKDNLNYARPWNADFTPYLMLGVNASYPFGEKATGTLAVLNGYWHLAHANDVPSAAAQLAYKAGGRTTLKQTVLYGPHQANTSLDFWRFLSDSIAEWKSERATVAFEFTAATERVDAAGRPRAWWLSGQLPMRFKPHPRWALAVRPELSWDSDGRWTLAEQTVKSFTTTLEHRVPIRKASVILRLEHRLDESTGRQGGFYEGAEISPGVIGLTPRQNLLTFAAILTFEGS